MDEFDAMVRALVERRGTDLHLLTGAVPTLRVDGRLERLDDQPLTAGVVVAAADGLLSSDQAHAVDTAGEVVTAVELPGLGRFRVHAYRSLSGLGIVLRRIDATPPTLAELGLPPVLAAVMGSPAGLVLVTGPPGAGRSTTLAALVDEVNRRRPAVVVTLEAPVEHRHQPDRALVVQREVGVDTDSLSAALRSTAGLGADVVAVGRLRDAEEVRAVVELAQGSVLVVAVLDAPTAAEAVARVVQAWPEARERLARTLLASALRVVVSQRLVARADGAGRVVAAEVLVGTPRVAEVITEPAGGAGTLEQLMADGEYSGMQTLDQALVRLVRDGLVTRDDALAAAVHRDDLSIALEAAKRVVR